MKNNFDTIIVGAGPAGLFCALELIKLGASNILILEKGNSIEKRSKLETLCGVGGSGTFSDGKLHFSLNLSQERLLDFVSADKARELLNYVEKSFLDFGVTAPVTPSDMEKAESFVKKCERRNIKLFTRRCRHVGSDALPLVIKEISNSLLKSGVEIKPVCDVLEIQKAKDGSFLLKTSTGEFTCNKLVLAPGRVGAKWLQNIAPKIGISYEYQKVEIGVRFEFPASVTEEQTKIMYEGIYFVQTPSFDDTVRTLCPCPNGFVAVEDYGGYICVNGHSNSQNESPNSNFALLQEVVLTEPVENTTDYAISIAKLATTLGGGKPLIQRLADLQAGRRSTASRIEKSIITSTLKDATPGDISMALPYRITKNLLEALEILDKVLPGINAGSNFLYAPEIKLRGSKIKTDKNLQTAVKNLFVAGDGAGVSGNIVGAASTGIIVARGILVD